jgi:hypothetical protein
MTAENPTTGEFQPSWTFINSSHDASPTYPDNPGDPAGPYWWPGNRTRSTTHVDKASVPGDTLLWLFSGFAIDSTSGNVSAFNDAWYYSVNAGFWRFVAGQKGAPNLAAISLNEPGPRVYTPGFFTDDTKTVLYLHGGSPDFVDGRIGARAQNRFAFLIDSRF